MAEQDRRALSVVTSPEQPIEFVRRGYAAFNAADIATVTELMDENVTWHTLLERDRAGRLVGYG